MSALYLTTDLLFSSRVTSAAADCHLDISVVSNEQQLLARVAAGGVHFVLLDFSTPDLNLLATVPHLRQTAARPIAIVAYGPHVDVAGMAGAKQAGCNAVYTRGQFDSQMMMILREFGCST